jgi:trk system potassium uptake protein
MSIHVLDRRKINESQVLALGFLLVILLGAALLRLPIASRDHVPIPWIDAIFTASSATCVTGLVVYDTYTQFTLFGQTVIILLIQVGGLGFMTVATMFSMFMGRRIGLMERGIMKESIGTWQVGGIVRMLKHVLIGTAILEGTGAILLSVRFIPQMGWITGIYYGIFHSVSAFCNAGFDIMGRFGPYSSLVPYQSDVLVNVVIMALIVIGGLGFVVWEDLYVKHFRFSRMSLHAKAVLIFTTFLIVSGAALFFFVERDNALKGLPLGTRILASFFQSVTPRTAGFNTVSMNGLTGGGKLLITLLMAVGGSPGSTAGGMKTTTVLVLFLASFSFVRGRDDVNYMGRRLDPGVARKAFTIATIYIFTSLLAIMAIVAMQPFVMEDVTFEVVSALSTVGLTTGITPTLNPAARVIISLLVYLGRVGAISVLMAFTHPQNGLITKKPIDKMIVG